MSTAISFRHSDIIFTSQIPPMEIVTDKPHLTVTISANGTELFCELLYPYNGVVAVYDVDSLVEEFMRNIKLFSSGEIRKIRDISFFL